MPSSCARLASAPDRQGPTGLHRLQGRIYETYKARCIFEQPGHRHSPTSESGTKFGFICRACPRGLAAELAHGDVERHPRADRAGDAARARRRACPRGLREQARQLDARPQRWLHGAGGSRRWPMGIAVTAPRPPEHLPRSARLDCSALLYRRRSTCMSCFRFGLGHPRWRRARFFSRVGCRIP